MLFLGVSIILCVEMNIWYDINLQSAGAHTIGQAQCRTFRAHIYNDANIDSSYSTSLRSNCPSTIGSGDNNLSPLDYVTPTAFDNNYYSNLKSKKGLLHSDQELFNGGSTDSQVTTYSSNENTFISDFAAAMVKMGNIQPLTGTSGEIRKNCRMPNQLTNWWSVRCVQ